MRRRQGLRQRQQQNHKRTNERKSNANIQVNKLANFQSDSERVKKRHNCDEMWNATKYFEKKTLTNSQKSAKYWIAYVNVNRTEKLKCYLELNQNKPPNYGRYIHIIIHQHIYVYVHRFIASNGCWCPFQMSAVTVEERHLCGHWSVLAQVRQNYQQTYD